MFKVVNVKDGSTVGSTECPHFIKKSSAGCFIKTDEKNAQGIAYNNAAYNLQGRDGIGVEDTVFLVKYDAGTEVDKNSAAIAENSAAIDNLIVSMLEA